MNNVIRLIGRRLVALPVMVLGVTFLVFVIMSLSPVDPAYAALGESATPEALEAFRESHGLNDPWLVQFGSYLVGLLHGDLGVYGQASLPVADKVFAALPVTMELTLLGLLIAIIFSFPLGVVSALYRDRLPDQLIRLVSVLCIATPSFWLAILLVLACMDSSLPVAGPLPGITEDPVGWLARMLLPATALAVPVIGQMTRIVRTSMVEELDSDYVRTALGAGIPRREVISRNVLRNALITPVTVLGLRVGYLMGGAVVIEIIFNLQGMGRVLIDGVTNSWTSVVQGTTLVVAVAFIVVNIVVDILYVLINPRIRSV